VTEEQATRILGKIHEFRQDPNALSLESVLKKGLVSLRDAYFHASLPD
jgi:hypothetical protein